ncbi:MAG: NAD-dependent epimerase/dehydratase family protein [Ilumatobacteraceae bacterium]
MTGVLVTGAAGFIGAAVSQRLLSKGREVVGVDNLNSYYDVRLKYHRLDVLSRDSGFTFKQIDIADADAVAQLGPSVSGAPIVHLAAQAGVRHSLKRPRDYVTSNLVGYANIAELARNAESPHLVYASTSSVYGLNAERPFRESHSVRHPLSLYAATKVANESIAHAYSHLFALPTTGLRFFTVYGPAGRPDMSPFIFTRKMLRGETIELYDSGNGVRDYTFIDDIVEGILAVVDRPAEADSSFDAAHPMADRSTAPFRVFNIGSGNPIVVRDYLEMLSRALGVAPKIEHRPAQDGDMDATHADTTALRVATGWRPRTSLADGTAHLAQWSRAHPSLLGG